MRNLKPVRLNELKLEAAFLLKDLKSNSSQIPEALSRFKVIPGLSDKTDTLITQGKHVKLKHAYQVLALERGFENWSDLKHFVVEKDCLYRPHLVPYVHSWFKQYRTAVEYHQKHGGYLLAFWGDIIVCGEEYIKGLELDTCQTEWQAVAFDWMKPMDQVAWQVLCEKAKTNYLKL